MLRALLAIDVPKGPQFGAGLRAGALAVGLGLFIGLVSRIRGIPIAGLLLAGATLIGLDHVQVLPDGLLWGTAALAGAGLIADISPAPLLVSAALAIPGAWLIATNGDLVAVTWIRAVVGGTAVAGGFLVADFDRRTAQLGLGPVLFAISVLGVYFAVPDTEQARVVLGAAVALPLLGWPWPLASLGAGGAFAASGVLAWTAAAGGYGRPHTIVGAVACLGLLVAAPVAVALHRSRDPIVRALRAFPMPLRALVAGGAQLSVVVVASRIVAARPTVQEATVAAGVLFVAATATTWMLLHVGRTS